VIWFSWDSGKCVLPLYPYFLVRLAGVRAKEMEKDKEVSVLDTQTDSH